MKQAALWPYSLLTISLWHYIFLLCLGHNNRFTPYNSSDSWQQQRQSLSASEDGKEWCHPGVSTLIAVEGEQDTHHMMTQQSPHSVDSGTGNILYSPAHMQRVMSCVCLTHVLEWYMIASITAPMFEACLWPLTDWMTPQLVRIEPPPKLWLPTATM